jgi:uncharacterized membrane-anchored protein
MTIMEILSEFRDAVALACAIVLLQLVTSVAVIRLYRRTGHGMGWALLALIPVGALPFVLPAIAVGYLTAEEAEWSFVAVSAISPALLLFLVLKRWPADASARPARD